MKSFFFSPLTLLFSLLLLFVLEKHSFEYFEKQKLLNFIKPFEINLNSFRDRVYAEQQKSLVYEYSYIKDIEKKKKGLSNIHPWLKDLAFFDTNKNLVGSYTLKENIEFFSLYMDFPNRQKTFSAITSKNGIYFISYVEDINTKEHIGYAVYHIFPDIFMEQVDKEQWLLTDIDFERPFMASNSINKESEKQLFKDIRNRYPVHSNTIIYLDGILMKEIPSFDLYLGLISSYKWWYYKSTYFLIFLFILFGFMQYLLYRVVNKKQVIHNYLERLKKERLTVTDLRKTKKLI